MYKMSWLYISLGIINGVQLFNKNECTMDQELQTKLLMGSRRTLLHAVVGACSGCRTHTVCTLTRLQHFSDPSKIVYPSGPCPMTHLSTVISEIVIFGGI